MSLSLALKLGLSGAIQASAGTPPRLTNSNSNITATNGAPPPPRLTNSNSNITAEAA